MANNFRVFAQNTTNIRNDTEYINLNERINGFQPQTAISSTTMNTVLRQSSLVSYAIAKMIVDGGYATNIGPNTNATTFQTYFENFMKGYFKKDLGLDTMSNLSVPYWNGTKFIGLTSSDKNMILGTGNNSSTPVWLHINEIEVQKSKTLNVEGLKNGVIPYKNIQDDFGWIDPPDSQGEEEYELITKYYDIKGGGQIPSWKRKLNGIRKVLNHKFNYSEGYGGYPINITNLDFNLYNKGLVKVFWKPVNEEVFSIELINSINQAFKNTGVTFNVNSMLIGMMGNGSENFNGKTIDIIIEVIYDENLNGLIYCPC